MQAQAHDMHPNYHLVIGKSSVPPPLSAYCMHQQMPTRQRAPCPYIDAPLVPTRLVAELTSRPPPTHQLTHH